ncbi:MAG: hypothetical protein JXB45_08710 [Candidatus Krumholzibacteriota bacterium]|nr:hypothetical protein [Candidatus Krumholzibacteriota bacterium]
MVTQVNKISLLFLGILIIAGAAGGSAGEVRATSYDREVGFIIGEPTGLSAKFWLGSSTAFDAGVAWSFRKEGHFHLHADYLYHNFEYLDTEKGELPVYLGIGGRVRFWEHDDSEIGVRFVAGVAYYDDDFPFTVFLELAPVLDLIPETEMDVNGGLGVRFLF